MSPFPFDLQSRPLMRLARRAPGAPLSLGVIIGLIVSVTIGTLLISPAQAQATTQAPENRAVSLPTNEASPVVWRLERDGTTLWFLGTYHLLPSELDWRSAPVQRALAEADSLYLEADVESPAAQGAMMRALVTEGFLPRGTTLADLIPADDVARLQEICESLGTPYKAIEVMRPWNAFLTISAQYLVTQGFDPNAGVDRALSLEVTASGRPIRYFETAAQQIGFFAGLSGDEERDLLLSTIREWDSIDAQTSDLFEAWRTGDAEIMDRIINDSMRDTSPAVFDTLIVKRNLSWIPQIEALIGSKQTILIAVGAGHLVGDASVIAMLEARGYRAERILE